MGSFFLRIRAWWETADRTQRVVTVFGALLLCALFAGTMYFASRPKMALLYGGLSSAEQGTVVDELTKMGIEYKLDAAGTVMVPSNKVTETRARLAVAGKLPTTGHMGYESFEKMGMMVTPKVEQERIKAAIEGELANTIEKIAGVSSARVHITLGEQTAFAREQKAPTASVVLGESQTGGVTGDEGRAIARLVQNAVTGLEASAVSIVTTDGRLLYDGQDENAAEGVADRKVRSEIAEAQRREGDLQRKLDAAFGPGATVASIPILEMNFDERNTEETTVTPSEAPMTRSMTNEEMGGATTTSSGTAGTDSNLPASPGFSSGSGRNDSYKGKQEDVSFAANQKRSSTRIAAGQITSMAINVLVNEAKIESKDKVDEFLRNYLGPKADDPNFTYGSTLVSFDTSAAKAAEKAASGDATSAKLQQALSILPIVALIFVGLMVVKALQKVGAATDVTVAALPGGGVAPMALGVPEGAPATHVAMAGALGDGGQAALPHPSGPGGPSMILDQSGNAPVVVGAIAERVHVPLEQIKHMATERPAAIAMLLKSWLLEDR